MRRWKPVLLAAGAFLGLIAVFVVGVNVVAARRWEETMRRTQEIEQELAAPVERAPLRGDALPGDAWDDYAAAAASRRSASNEEQKALAVFIKIHRALSEHPEGHPANPLPAVVARLREGARRTTAGRPPGAGTDFDLLDALLAQARCAAASGMPGEAYALLADLARIAQDATQVGSSLSLAMGWDIAFRALDDLIALLGAGAASSRDLLELEGALAALDASVPPPGRFLLRQRNDMAEKAQAYGTFGGAFSFGGLGWKNLWSGRLYFAGALDEVESWARSLADLRDRPWSEVEQRAAQAREEAARTGIGYLAVEASSFKLELYSWSFRARLRVARAGAVFRTDGRKLELEDPFGGKLLWDDQGVRSRGPTDDPKDDIILRLKP